MRDPVDSDEDLSRFPGGKIVQKGLLDLAQGNESIEAIAVCVARPRLIHLGFTVPEHPLTTSSEHRLYELMSEKFGEAGYAKYNAFIRLLASFLNAYRK